ncbi:MAG: M48 family metalloprotease [Ignavibacteriales bacterium]|nr:M48 family metalloprotease [Ignavibacteriales bacterium]
MEEFIIPTKIPDKNKLETSFKVFVILNYITLFLVITANIYLSIKLIDVAKTETHFFIIFLSLGLILFFFTKPYIAMIFMRKKLLLNIDDSITIGNFTIKKIKEIFYEVIEKFNRREKPKIYLMREKHLGVFTINSLFFNFIKSVNAIYISESQFYRLNEFELKAIIAHEAAHFYKYMFPLFRSRIFVFLLIGLLPAYLSIITNSELVILLFFFFSTFFIIGIFYALIGVSKSKVLEYLSDYYAAENYGKLNFINGLLTVAKNIDVYHYYLQLVLRMIRKDKKLSINYLSNIIELVEKNLPEIVTSPEQIKNAVKITFQSKELKELKLKIPEETILKENKRINRKLLQFYTEKPSKVVNWNLFDNIKRDNKINQEEYQSLLKVLIKNPDSVLLSYETYRKVKLAGTHPKLSERILFLEKNRLK